MLSCVGFIFSFVQRNLQSSFDVNTFDTRNLIPHHMTVYKEYRVGGGNSPMGFLGPLLILTLFFGALFFLAKGVFWLLSWVFPILILITLIVDYQVIIDFFKFVWKLLKENTIMGILAVLLIAFGYPIVAGYLCLKAISRRSLRNVMTEAEKNQSTFTEYEEVVEDESFLELPPLQKNTKSPVQKQANPNEYDDMFK